MVEQRKNYKILSLKPSTKHMAVAVLDNQDLVYWRNKRIREKKIPEIETIKSLKNTIERLIGSGNRM